MSDEDRYIYEEELKEPGTFDVRGIPDKSSLVVRLLHYEPSPIGRVIDVHIESEKEGTKRISIAPGDDQFKAGVKLRIWSED